MFQVSEDALHELPLLVTAGVGTAALELGDVSFPLGLTREGGKAGHVPLEVKIVLDIHYHEQAAALAVDLHIEDANFTLALNDLRPYVGVGFNILSNHLFVIDQGQCLTVSLHNQELENLRIISSLRHPLDKLGDRSGTGGRTMQQPQSRSKGRQS